LSGKEGENIKAQGKEEEKKAEKGRTRSFDLKVEASPSISSIFFSRFLIALIFSCFDCSEAARDC